METAINARARLGAEISARRTEEQRRRWRRMLWIHLLTSLWAPLTAFGLAFVPYVVLVEFARESYQWAQPLLKDFGLVMVAWFAGLVAVRLVPSGHRWIRRLHREAAEQTAHLDALLRRYGHKLDARTREKLVEQAAQVDAAKISGDPNRLEAEIKKLSELIDKHLSAWKKASSLEFFWGFAKALAIALLIRTVLVEPFKIPSGSMLPTLAVGDQVFVNKFIYGVRLPWLNIVPFTLIRRPARGDVIVFNNPVDESKDFIKRVVGLPGDHVELMDEVVYINGTPQPRQLVALDDTVYNQEGGEWLPEQAVLYDENLSGVHHAVLQSRHHPRAGMTEGPFVVPTGHVFVMGDNRDNSSDSRYGLGVPGHGVEYVPYGNIKGKAMVVWLSLSYGGLGSRLFGGTGLRTDRLFLPVR